jgi:ribosomal protein L37AE/L43A
MSGVKAKHKCRKCGQAVTFNRVRLERGVCPSCQCTLTEGEHKEIEELLSAVKLKREGKAMLRKLEE